MFRCGSPSTTPKISGKTIFVTMGRNNANCSNRWESLNGGLANGGLRYTSASDHDCLQLSSFCDKESLYKRPQMCCTIEDDYAQIAESGLKPPFERPHLDFPNTDHVCPTVFRTGCHFYFAFILRLRSASLGPSKIQVSEHIH